MIRKYKEQDQEQLLYVWEEASKIAHSFLHPLFIASERENIPKLYLPIAETYVYEADNIVVGFMSLIGDEIGALFVDPEYQGKGIGRKFVDFAKTIRDELVLNVFEENTIGRGFYDKYGFEIVERHIHELTNLPLIRMKLTW